GEQGTGEARSGTARARPPWAPVKLGLLAGRAHEPARLTAIHHRHAEAGAEIIWTGAWRRPHPYGDARAEARTVHEAVGVIDVSTLGKLLVAGPDAVEFLERLYPNRYGDLKPGRVRYGVLSTDAGRIMDDGTIARLGEEQFYVTTTSTGAEAVVGWFEWWNAVWRMDVEIVNLTGAVAAVNVAGPQARELLGRVTSADVSNEGFKYLDAHHAHVAGVPCLMLRNGFVGKWALEHAKERGSRELLVGFEMANATVPPEGGQVVRAGRPSGRVTSSRWSRELGRAIGLAWLPPELAEENTPFEIRVDGRLEPARVRLRPFFDPEGTRLRA